MRARDNPFRVERLHRLRFRPPGTTWPPLLDRLSGLGYRAGLCGNEGSGKTTLLLELEKRLRGSGFETLRLRLARGQSRLAPVEHRALCEVSARTVLLVDSGGGLSRRGWRELTRAAEPAAGLVVTTHRPGPLPLLLECTTSADLLGRLLGDLLPASARPAPSEVEDLFLRHRGNLRNALRELYDQCARGVLPCGPDRTRH